MSYAGLITHTFQPQFSKFLVNSSTTNKNFQKFELQYSLDLLGRCAQMLYTDFSASRQMALVGVSNVI